MAGPLLHSTIGLSNVVVVDIASIFFFFATSRVFFKKDLEPFFFKIQAFTFDRFKNLQNIYFYEGILQNI